MNSLKDNYNFKRLKKDGESSWDDVVKRFINELISKGCKTSKEDLEWLLLNYYALPNSPGLLTAGKDGFYASACSSYPLTDSMDENSFAILNTLKISSMATKAGIGTGYNFSLLRGKEEPVRGVKGLSGGPVSFLRAINGFVREITQATRKSAAMGTLSVHHPDVIDYINCKKEDGTIENFNLSLLISDEFMEAVKNDTDYELRYPKTGEVKKVNAKEVFDLIAKNTWDNGEPGLLYTGNIKKDYFIDTLDDNHILNNPCKPLKSLVLTNEGYRTFEQLMNEKDILSTCINGTSFKMTKPFLTKKKAEVYKMKISNGSYIYGTRDHKHKDDKGRWKDIGDFKIGDKLLSHFSPIYDFKNINNKRFDLGFLSGWVYAEGFVYKVDECNCRVVGTCVGKNEFDLIPYLKTIFIDKMFDHMQKPNTCKCFRTGKKEIVSKILNEGYDLDKTNLNWLYLKDRSFKIGFLQAMFTFDGSVRPRNKAVELYSINRDALFVIQNILREFGIYSTFTYHNKARSYVAKDGKERNNKETFKLCVPAYMFKKLKFKSDFKNQILDKIDNKESKRIENKKKYLKVIEAPILDSIEDVYDIKVDNIHCFDDSGVIAHNCSEALLSYDETPGNEWLEMCVLGSINIPKFKDLNQKDAKRVVFILVSMLNDIIDIQDYVTPYQEKGMKKVNRKIGIGVAGLATAFALSGIKYDSKRAYDYTKELMELIGEFAEEKSKQLYEERKDTLDKDSPLHKLKRYNASLLSIAPTSSLANIFNDMNKEGCSYGVEPYFTIEPYTIHNSYGDFEKKEKILDIIDKDTKNNIQCANDLNWKAHVDVVKAIMDASWGKGIMQSVSKTVNFKNNVTVDEVKEAIMYCWENKVKGISFYRDGSRKNQVIQTKDSYKDCIEVDDKGRPTKINYMKAPKRPDYLCCDIHRFQSNKERWVAFVGLLEGKVYEVFCGSEESINIPKKYEKGMIKKDGKRYDLIIGETEEDTQVIKNIPKQFENKNWATSTRLTSALLRHGTPIQYIVDQLMKDGNVTDINKAIARVLKKYIEDDVTSGETCPNCGLKLKYISSCLGCVCGYSLCG
jgi:ribonucleoside-diphosphate reductase alpha chain